jgi:methylase of polypeptide subunit release factors
LLEIGYDQKDRLEMMIAQSHEYENFVFHKDYSGHDRVVEMQRKI